MTKKNKLLLLGLAAILLIALCLGVVSCTGGGEPDSEGPAAPVVGTEKRTYTVILKTEGGKLLEDVGVYFYTDSTMAELVWFAKTDAAGQVSFTDLESTGYVAVLDNVPEGYKVEPYYPLTGETTEIVLTTDMTDGDLASITYKLGDVMMNFSVTDADGNVWVLSDLLAEKEAVVLNFWYLQCAPCRAEFPYLQEAWENYSDKIALLALNPINDDNEAIKAFAQELGLTFPVAHCDPNWEKAMQLTAYPTTVIIDRYGTIALIHKGSIDDAKVFEDAFAFFTAEDYEQTTVEDIMDLEIVEEGADSTNPIEIGSKTSIEITLAPGQTVYYHIYRVDGMTLTVSNKNISAVYNKMTYSSGNGLSFTVHCADTYTPAAVSFTNDGEETETFTVRLIAQPGTVDNPHTLKNTGDFTVKISAGNDQGVYHTYKPKEDGLLTVQCTGISPANVKYGISLTTQKGNATVQRNLEEDGDTENGSVSIPVKKGVIVQIVVSTLPDDTKSYPAATLKCTLSMGENTSADGESTEKLTYAVTVTDQDLVPVQSVLVTFTKVSDEEEKPEEKLTQEAGAAIVEMERAVYEVTLSKKGYEASTPRFHISPERPYVSVRMTPVVVEIVRYTIVVKDMNGEAVPNATVSIGSEKKTTDADGTAVFELQKGSFEILVRPPEDSGLAMASMSTDGENTVVEISLQESSSDDGAGEEENTAVYTVTVVDYSGTPQPGVDVQFRRASSLAAAPITDGNGRVTVSLVPDDYTLSLAGTSLHYEPARAVMPKGTTELTIKLAPAVDEDVYEMVWDMYCCYYIYVGGNYAKMEPDAVNYYIFAPQEPGVYRFSTSNPEAILSYRGTSNWVSDMTGTTDYDPATNSFTLDYSTNQIGHVASIIGVTGAEECIIEVTWIRSSIQDENELPSETYNGTHTPKPFTISKADGKKLDYVDITADTDSVKIVLGSDGYYYLNSAAGPRLYMNLGPNARYVSMYNMLGHQGFGGTFFGCIFRDENGNRKEEYNTLMDKYIEAIDPTYGVYPLTEDLVYMMRNGGDNKGWWDPDNAQCLFLDENDQLDSTINLDIAWMFAVMYVQ